MLGLREDRVVLGEDGRGEDLGMRDHRAEDDLIALHLDAAKLIEVVDVDEDVGPGETQLHHRQEAVAACEDSCFFAVLLKQTECVSNGRCADIVHRCGCLHPSRLSVRLVSLARAFVMTCDGRVKLEIRLVGWDCYFTMKYTMMPTMTITPIATGIARLRTGAPAAPRRSMLSEAWMTGAATTSPGAAESAALFAAMTA